MQVQKRNKEIVEFNKDKIFQAIDKAYKQVKGEVVPLKNKREEEEAIQRIIEVIIEQNQKRMADNSCLAVEEIQDIVERELMKNEFFDVARAYVRYRYKKEILRQTNRTYEGILKLVEMQNDELKEENSNKNANVASTQRDYIAGEVSKDLSHRILLPLEVVKAHDAGEIHFHKYIVA